MLIAGLKKKDSDILTNPYKATINYALKVASQSPEERDAILTYYVEKRAGCSEGPIGHQLYSEYLAALKNETQEQNRQVAHIIPHKLTNSELLAAIEKLNAK